MCAESKVSLTLGSFVPNKVIGRRRTQKLIDDSLIQRRAEEQWEALPPQFRLESSLKQCAQSPFDRDFLAHVRLNHLHVLFLLRLLLLNTLTEPDIPIIETAGQMLALVVELILLRDQLTNSGTGLIWKVHMLPPILQAILESPS